MLSVPGFNLIRSAEKEMRGGVAVLISNEMWRFVRDVDTRRDQVWLRIEFAPEWKFGACYVPPADSLFFSRQSFADIQDQASSKDKICVIGDFSSRIPNLCQFDNQARGVNPRPAGPLDFPPPAGGGGAFERPPMISASGRRREKRKAAFESSRKIISKSFRSFFGSGQN